MNKVTTTETVVVLRDKKVDGHINVNLDVEKLGIHDNKATYDDLKAYVDNKYGYKVEHQKRQRIAHEKLSTTFGAEVRVNRSIQVEGRFALQKQQFGLRRFSSFGRKRVFSEWLICCMAANTVQLAARIEQEKVGTPFWYKISSETA